MPAHMPLIDTRKDERLEKMRGARWKVLHVKHIFFCEPFWWWKLCLFPFVTFWCCRRKKKVNFCYQQSRCCWWYSLANTLQTRVYRKFFARHNFSLFRFTLPQLSIAMMAKVMHWAWKSTCYEVNVEASTNQGTFFHLLLPHSMTGKKFMKRSSNSAIVNMYVCTQKFRLFMKHSMTIHIRASLDGSHNR